DCSEPPLAGDVCNTFFPVSSTVTLTATPGPGSTPVQWGFDCAGTPQGNPCTLVMDQARSAQATFVLGLTRATPGGSSLRWMSQIEARDAAGQTFVNGGLAASQKTGRAEVRAAGLGEQGRGVVDAGAGRRAGLPVAVGSGVTHVEAVLTEARGPGL